MHPAYSVIFFTTASGAGYGLLIWLGVAQVLDQLPQNWWFRFAAFGLSLGLVTAGLLSSMLHLGRPERAMKAFSQWRTSWLSREGVLAVIAYAPAGLFALATIFDLFPALTNLWAAFSILGALATVWCTAMIYASLTTIRAWNDSLVPPAYVILALATGAILLCGLMALMDRVNALFVWAALLSTCAAWALKTVYWSRLDDHKPTLTTANAIGLTNLGTVRPLEPPHSQDNFVMREMGFAVARKHVERLRLYTVVALFLIPALSCVALLALPLGAAPLAGTIAILSSAAGILTERWLFFAEAKHVVTLYYGAEGV